MIKVETLEGFYRERYNPDAGSAGPFYVFSYNDCIDASPIQYRRRDFFKITLLRGNGIIHYGDKSLETSGSTLAFFNPDIPYTFEATTGEDSGYFCIFRVPYFNEHYRSNIKDLPVFSSANKPTYHLDEAQDEAVSQIFRKMQTELASDYAFKHDLIRNYIVELIHFALKLQPTEKISRSMDANVRITTVFNELLDRQFPIESANQRFELRSARDFAEKMSVHVNHLNRALRATTGKTTTEHIAERLASEARVLLKHTHWNIVEISYSLGFEDPAHFNRFFKKQTNQTPSNFRV